MNICSVIPPPNNDVIKIINHGNQWDHFNIGEWPNDIHFHKYLHKTKKKKKKTSRKEFVFREELQESFICIRNARKMYQTFCKFFSVCFLKDKKAWNFASNELQCFTLSFIWWFTTIHKKDNIMYFILLTKLQKSFVNATTNLLHTIS